jgi:hypothetical protein
MTLAAAWGLGLGPGLRLAADPYLLADPTLRVIRTGVGLPLQEVGLTLSAPPGVRAFSVEFTVGFASRESIEPASFLDSFSVFLSGKPLGGTGLLLTADAPGVVWLPPLPGGLTLAPTSTSQEPMAWPLTSEPTFAVQFAYRFRLSLPPTLPAGPLELRAQLFDNLDTRVSLGFIDDAVLMTDPFFLVESAASPQGPYALELSARHDPARQRFVVPHPDVARFFRLKADSGVTLRILEPTAQAWRFSYAFLAAPPVLESAPAPGGPWSVETRAVRDDARRTFTVPPEATGRFFRIAGPVRTRLGAPVDRGDRLELGYEFRPQVFSLQSSAEFCGPFADEQTARFETSAQTIELARPEPVRFFRLVQHNGATPPRVSEVQLQPEGWVVRYDFGPRVQPSALSLP